MNKFWSTFAAVSAAGLLTTAALAADLKLRFGHVAPTGSNYDVAAHGFASKVKAKSGGTIEIEVIGNGVLGAQPQLLAQLRTGALDFWTIDTSGISMAKEARNFQVMLMPYLFRDQEHFRKFIDSGVFAEMMAVVGKEVGVRHVGLLTDLTPRALSTSKAAVRTPADLRGVKVRVPEVPIFLAVWKEWGANPTPVKATDLFQALQSGMVEGQENGISVVVELSLTDVQKYFSTIDYSLSALSLYVSGQTWDKLDDKQRGWMVEAAKEVYAESRAAYPKYVDELFAKARAKGVTIVEPDHAAFRSVADRVALRYDGEMWTKGLFQRIREVR